MYGKFVNFCGLHFFGETVDLTFILLNRNITGIFRLMFIIMFSLNFLFLILGYIACISNFLFASNVLHKVLLCLLFSLPVNILAAQFFTLTIIC